MAFFKPVVLLNVMKVISPHYNRSLHLHGLHNSSENLASYTHSASEGALLVNVMSFYSLGWEGGGVGRGRGGEGQGWGKRY